MAKKNRMPKKGDLVTALGHTGTFEVVSVDSQNRVVDLRNRFCAAIVGDAKCAEASPISNFPINDFAAGEAMIWKRT